MKILLDHNLDRRLKASFADHDISTTQENGWADEVNGELLRLAQANGFSVLLTADANSKNQQNLTDRDISIVILRAFNNRLSTLTQMIDDIRALLSCVKPGTIVEVFHPDMR